MTPDWNKIENYSWYKPMFDTPQDEEYHAEGNVGIHTRMVVEALLDNPHYQDLSDKDREVLYWAALLHDVAKPATTKMVNGRWSSPYHSVIGETMARELMWTGQTEFKPKTFEEREAVTTLVRYHGLPVNFIHKKDPAKPVIAASLDANLWHVYLLARADRDGRISKCNDHQEKYTTLDTFAKYAEELDCLNDPYNFKNDLHKFVHLKLNKDLWYEPYDDYKGELILMAGAPGSGKTTWIKENHPNAPVVSLDDIRVEKGIDPADKNKQQDVVNAGRDRLISIMRSNRNKGTVVYDATNLRRDYRSSLVALAEKYAHKSRIVYVECFDRQRLLKQNKNRDKVVPENVINKMLGRMEMVRREEAVSVDYVIHY